MKPIHSLMQRLLLAAVTVTVVALRLPGADDTKPTRAAFINEVLDAKPTPVTPKFDDYTPGSYHIERDDLLKGLEEEAKKRKLSFRAVAIIGPMPYDPLWTSRVVVFIQEGEKVRVNSLVMPHARITGKGTGLITTEQYKTWLEGVVGTGAVQTEVAKVAGDNGKRGEADMADNDILLATWSTDGKTREVFRGSMLRDQEKTKKLFEVFNTLLKETKPTYPEQGK
jgi:hypothetical protein